MEAYHCGWSSTESVSQLAYHNCILVLSVKRQKLPDAHFETSMFNILQPNIHGVIGFCITIVLSGDKYERNTAKTLQVFQCPLSSRSRYQYFIFVWPYTYAYSVRLRMKLTYLLPLPPTYP